MLESPVLRAPGAQGVFEPNTRSIGIPFAFDVDNSQTLADWWDDLLRPTAGTWRQTYLLYHELVHFYQFHATSWGLLHQVLGRAEFRLLSGFLRAYADCDDDVSLPLLGYGASRSLSAIDGDDPRILLRYAYLLDLLRRHIFGYEPAARSPFGASGDDEYLQLVDVLHHLFGMPKIMVVQSESFRSTGERARPPALRIDDLLESHAHALSSLWMFQAVERFELDPEIGRAVLRSARRAATGSYGSILSYAYDLPIDERYELAMLSTICDLSLNAIDPRWILHGTANPEALLHIMDDRLDPIANCLTLVRATIDGDLPVLQPGAGLQSMVDEYLDRLSSFTFGFDHLADHSLSISDIRDSPLVRALQPNEVLNDVTLDILGTYTGALEVRRTHHPLVLGGLMIEDLGHLVSALGVPNILSHVDGSAQPIPSFRYLTGLALLGGRDDDLGQASARANRDDIQIVSTIRNLLLMNRDEFEAEPSAFGVGSHPPSTVLGIWWGLDVEDFSHSHH